MNHPRRWRIGAVAAAIALSGSLASLQVHALGLGRVSVQSALGEPLRAEIEIVEINADEAATLRTSVASSDAFKAAGLEYSTAVANVQISLQRRPDGRAYLRLSSDRPVNEPFVDLILEARWASGRIVRDYTMLFDPPNLRQAGNAPPMAAPTAPTVSQPPRSAPTLPAPPPAAVAPSYPTSPPPSTPAPVAKVPSSGGQKITVKVGDTAGKIAAQHKSASVSLDQMLVALLLSNPDAFIGGNVNRLKTGAVLELPGSDQAEAIPASEATRTIVAQSKNFNEFRRKLAEGAPDTRLAGAGRQATGQVQAKVEDRVPAAATPDKLTLSKGAAQSKAAEEKIAQERQAKEAAARVAELSKNISDLNKLGSTPAAPAAPAAPGASAAPSPQTPGVAVAKPGVLAGALPAASALAAMPAASSALAPATPASAAAAPVASAPASAAAAPVKKPVLAARPPPPAQTSLVDDLIENPLVLAGGAGLLVLLAAFGVYRVRQRKNSVAVDSSFLESRLQPDSFFGASGGQRIDTDEASATGSSMVYSPSQLDAAGDVDPVAEADVYLAYGRDLQAEEILKEAMRVSPSRIAIHSKLLEIYAKRRDAKAFEVVAAEAFRLTKGHGTEWAQAAEMGRGLDPANPMYQPDGQPAPSSAGGAAQAGAVAAGVASPPMAQAVAPAPAPSTAAVDFDLDLDFSLDDKPAAPAPVPAARTEPTASIPSAVSPPTKVATPEPPSQAGGLSFTAAPVVTSAASALDAGGGMMEFDLGALSLDLDGPTTESPKIAASAPAPSGMEDPLATKFALAEEFRAIGDVEGARSLAEEVLAQSSGSLKGQVQAFINALS